ncbi:hypothetical protein IHE45_14G059200 [Dioscorea alata]|uniref:Uncharacterized protein n=1 Tax=Dioscorea alata TaxID=55571 RepID=A0ACB7US07_DIOAL|nr:hypothetical protein IHE45_14G059200 [Dioscorea alata]
MPLPDSDQNPAVIGSIPASPTPSDPDLPAESILIRIDDGFDWSDLNAAVFSREYSTKGSTNPKSMIQSHPNPNPNPNPNPLSTSQRFSANPKVRAPIIGFSNVGYDGLRRRKDVPGTAPPPAYLEPASPKVSCLGRVSSERSRGDGKVRCWSGFQSFRRARSGVRRMEEMD